MQSPLADRLRPRTLAEVCGQQHLLGPGRVFRKAIESGRVPNMIFYGPSGVGKTTVARIIAENSGMRLHKLNGTSAGTGDIKAVMAEIGTFQSRNGLLLYLDEIQYLNKKQQQSLLECMEDGTVTLIASTTENPYFYIYNALLSRATVFEFKPLTPEDVRRGLENALHKLEELDGVRIEAQPEALDALAAACGGDMRKALGSLEFAVAGAAGTDGAKRLTTEAVRQVAQRSSQRYDKSDDMHYDCISALQKSIRGSDPDAAVHYLARILEAGDLLSACRRPCVPAGHSHREGLRGQRPAAGPAGSAPAAGGRGRADGNRAQKQFGAQRHSGRGTGPAPGQNRPGAPPAAEQAFRRRGRGAKGAELSVPARLSGPLGEAAVPAGRAGGRALLRIRTKQKRAGREGLLGQNQEVRARQAGAEAGRAPPAPAARAAGGRREQAREIRFLEKYNE